MTGVTRIALSVLLAIGAAQAPPAAARGHGADPDPAALARLRTDMHRLVDTKRRAGIVYGVLYKGRVVALDAYGYRDVARHQPMTTHTIFRLFSMSRAISSAAILTLVDDGRMSLEERVAKFLPEVDAMKVIAPGADGRETLVPQSPRLTIRHLFTYTAGLGYAFAWPKHYGFGMSDVLQLDQPTRVGIRRLSTMPLLEQPGTAWRYGFSSDMLGAAAEVASGEPLDRFLQHRLFARIGMKDTGFWVPPDKIDRLSRAYGRDGDQPLADITTRFQKEYGTFATPVRFFSAGGGLASTVPDYLRFCHMLLNGGTLNGVRVLRPETVRMMISRQTTPEQGLTFWYEPPGFSSIHRNQGWGLGIGVVTSDTVPAEAPGARNADWGGLMNTFFFIDPERELAAVAMAQYMGPDANALGTLLRDGTYAAIPPRRR